MLKVIKQVVKGLETARTVGKIVSILIDTVNYALNRVKEEFPEIEVEKGGENE